ncbi:hypothetical protein OHA72_10415 [Dactylosporangium sp. NBC_01737]|uniref:hypothetical protein n=1 Tax=Dactylosporangium sp. NBC_01737 TaxID=2975959 RepID=UPI002E0FAA88|nr:hypothetical protein OHA72_10415 [Dactylosporangium sp. NBC_01737]
MHNGAYVGRPDPTDPTMLHLRRIDADAAPETIVPAIHAIRQRTFDGDTIATAAALLEHHWTRLDAATTAAHTCAAGDTPVAGVGTIRGEDDVEPPTTLSVTRLGELPGRWVYLIDPSADTLAVLSTDGPAHLLSTGLFPRLTADPATTGQPSPDAADTTASPAAATAPPCPCRQRAEAAEARLAEIEAQAAHVRQHVRDGVAAGNFDLDVTNDLLERLGLEPLPRYWTVNLLVAMTVTVPATDSDDAVDTARDLVENFLDDADIVDGYDVNDVDTAIAGGLADEPPASPARRPASRPDMA